MGKNEYFEKKVVVFSRDGSRHSNPYDEVYDFVNGFARVRNGNEYGFMNEKLEEIASPKYLEARNFVNGFAAVKTKYGWGAIDKTGKEVVQPHLKYLGDFNSAGLAPFKSFDLYGAINQKGDIVVETMYKSRITFSEGLAPVKKGYRWGYINENYEVVIPFEYDLAGDFKRGKALVLLPGREHHFINKDGIIIK